MKERFLRTYRMSMPCHHRPSMQIQIPREMHGSAELFVQLNRQFRRQNCGRKFELP